MKRKKISITGNIIIIIVIVIISCQKEIDNTLIIGEKPTSYDNLPIAYTTNDFKIVATNDFTLSNGIVMFNLQLEQEITEQNIEEEIINNAVTKLKDAIKKLAKRIYKKSYVELKTLRGKKEILQGEEVVGNINYEKKEYVLANEQSGEINKALIYQSDWKQISVTKANANTTSSPQIYTLSDISFAMGVTAATHVFNLSVLDKTVQYNTVISALTNAIGGNITLGKRGDISFYEGLASGRIALISGEVVERVTVDDSQIQSVPVILSEGEMILTFYTEDAWDFDYNDSFITVTFNTRKALEIVDNQVFEVNEYVGEFTEVGTVSVVNNNDISSFEILSGNTFVTINEEGEIILENTFYIIEDGRIFNLTTLNYDQRSQYSLEVKVIDTEGNTATNTITINVIDSSIVAGDNQANIIISGQVFEVFEGVGSNAFIGTLSHNEGVDIASISFIAGNLNNAFRIATDGDIWTVNEIDYENQSSYLLTIQAIDNEGNIDLEDIRIDVNEIDLITINGITYVSNETMVMYPNGQVSNGTLVMKTMIDGIEYYGDGTEDLSTIIFYENGQVMAGGLPVPTMINNVMYSGQIDFYENGVVKEGTLVSNQMIEGINYMQEEELYYHINGMPKWGTLSSDQMINGAMFLEDTAVIRYESGQIFKGVLTTNTIIAGYMFQGESGEETGETGYISYYSNGQVRDGILTESITLFSVYILEEDRYISFYENGQIRSAYLKSTNSFNLPHTGESCQYSGYFELYHLTSSLRQLILTQDCFLEGTFYTAGTVMLFDSDGSIISGRDIEEDFPFEYTEDDIIGLEEPEEQE